jgi:signal transduction histidine kinase
VPPDEFYQAVLAVPIVVRDEVYGGILLLYVEPRTFSEEEVELAVIFADQVALAIENARLKDELEQAAASAERSRLARDLHDAVTQTLFSASLIAEALPRVWEHHPAEARQGLEDLRQLTRGALAEMRTMLLELRPAALTEKPLGESLRHLTEAVTSRTRVPVALTVAGHSALKPDVQVALYRIAQEALNNMAKHAGASRASVCLDCQPGVAMLDVWDDGCGFDPADILPDQFGVAIMRERAASLNAELKIVTQPGQGTQITVHWQDTAAESTR